MVRTKERKEELLLQKKEETEKKPKDIAQRKRLTWFSKT